MLAEGSDQGEDKELEVEVDVVGGADDCHGTGVLLSAAPLATVDGESEHGDTDGRLCTGTQQVLWERWVRPQQCVQGSECSVCFVCQCLAVTTLLGVVRMQVRPSGKRLAMTSLACLLQWWTNLRSTPPSRRFSNSLTPSPTLCEPAVEYTVRRALRCVIA